MFDVGFFELVVLSVVALLVLGPEKLPGTIRTVSLWIGRLRRSFNNIKQDIEREVGADEIRRQLRNEAILDKFRQTQSRVNETISAVKKDADTFRKNIELESQAAASALNPLETPPSTAAPAPAQTPAPAIADTSVAAAAPDHGPAPSAPAPTETSAPDPRP